MPPKPHRVLLDRVSGYADEGAAFMRRRRVARQPFVRLYYAGGRSTDIADDTDQGTEVFDAAAAVIELAGAKGRS